MPDTDPPDLDALEKLAERLRGKYSNYPPASPEHVLLRFAPWLIARARRCAVLETALADACDTIDGGSAYCGDCDRGCRADSLRAVLAKGGDRG